MWPTAMPIGGSRMPVGIAARASVFFFGFDGSEWMVFGSANLVSDPTPIESTRWPRTAKAAMSTVFDMIAASMTEAMMRR